MDFKNFNKYEEFQKWFGNSKIIKNGKPLLVYHSNFKDKIDPHNKTRIYFTDDSTFGKRYLGHESNQHKAYLRIIKPFLCTDRNLIELFKDKSVPLSNQYKEEGKPYKDWAKKRADDFNFSDRYERDRVYYWIKEMRYDGAIIPHDWDGGMSIVKSFVVFDFDQIWEVKD